MIRLFKNLQIIRIFSKKNYFLQKIWGGLVIKWLRHWSHQEYITTKQMLPKLAATFVGSREMKWH